MAPHRSVLRPFAVPLLAVALLATGAVRAAPFEDPLGRFALELPSGWELEPQAHEDVFVFSDGKQNVIVQYLADVADPAALFRSGMDNLIGGGMATPKPDGETRDLDVNGRPARLGAFSGDVAAGSMKVALAALVGGVAVDDDGGVFLLWIADPKSFGKLRTTVEGAFGSIRKPGGAVSGITEGSAVAASALESAPVAVDAERLSVTLPPGWTEKPRGQDWEKEVVGMFQTARIRGGMLIVVCDRGMGLNQEKEVKAAKISVEGGLPQAQPARSYETRLDDGRKVAVVVYSGAGVSEGMQLPMSAVTATLKARKCWVNLIGFAHADGAAALESDVLSAASSAK